MRVADKISQLIAGCVKVAKHTCISIISVPPEPVHNFRDNGIILNERSGIQEGEVITAECQSPGTKPFGVVTLSMYNASQNLHCVMQHFTGEAP